MCGDGGNGGDREMGNWEGGWRKEAGMARDEDREEWERGREGWGERGVEGGKVGGQGRAGQGRAGQGRAGQGRAGQGRAGQGRAGQGRAGRQGWMDEWMNG